MYLYIYGTMTAADLKSLSILKFMPHIPKHRCYSLLFTLVWRRKESDQAWSNHTVPFLIGDIIKLSPSRFTAEAEIDMFFPQIRTHLFKCPCCLVSLVLSHVIPHRLVPNLDIENKTCFVKKDLPAVADPEPCCWQSTIEPELGDCQETNDPMTDPVVWYIC